jgi:hypothetical protein
MFPRGLPATSSHHTVNAASTHSSAMSVSVTLGGQVLTPCPGAVSPPAPSPALSPVWRRAAIGAASATPAEYPASATPLWTARAAPPVPAATPSRTRLPVITLLNTLPSARNDTASTAPVVSVRTTTSVSRIVTCQRCMRTPATQGIQSPGHRAKLPSGVAKSLALRRDAIGGRSPCQG